MILLLEGSDFWEENGIRPRSLKVTTISALTGEIVTGKANLAQLAAQWNYRAVDDQDMRNGYSRNLAHQQLFVSNFAQKSFIGNQNADGLNANVPDFAGKSHGDSASLNIEVHGRNPWAGI